MSKQSRLVRGRSVLAAGLLAACGAATQADVVTEWNQAVLDSITATGTTPPVASRDMAIMHLSIYDAVNGISRRHEPYRVATNPPPASMEAAAAQAGHDALVELFPGRAALFGDLLSAQLAAIPDGPAKDAGLAQGAFVAAEILDWRADDGSAGPGSYTPGGDPGGWKPTAPGYLPALLPHWGTVTCFAMDSGSQFRPIEPPAMITLDYLDAWNEVYELGGVDSTARTADQTEIAYIWEGGPGTPTPPGQWNEIAQTLSASQGYSLEDNARLFAWLNLATADAAINAWDCKYHFDYWRPITAIWEADLDGNPDTAPDPSWIPLLTTPPFPTYTSGHSTFSGASARVLINALGTDSIPFTFEAIGLSRDFTSIWTAAEEAGISRIYGGIHYNFDNTAALDAGGRLGDYISSNYLLPVCRADLDGNGALNIYDFLEFINAYLAGSGQADFDADGRIDAMDFLQFQNEFAAGCR